MLKASHKSNSNSSSNNSSSKTNKVIENGMKENGVEKRPANDKDPTEPVDKKKRIMEKIHYEDLDSLNSNEDAQELKLSKVSCQLLF